MKSIYVNIDINTVNVPFLNDLIRKDTFYVEDLYPFVDIYRGTQVTDILFNIFAQSSVTDSDCWDSYKELYERTEENGIPVDYKDYWNSYYVINQVYKTDPFAVWIARCRSNGQNPWISIRMNDAHGFDNDTYLIRSQFYYTALKNGWVLGENYGYYKGCYNYAVPEVREKMLSYIREQVTRYDVYGLELDFVREIQCFPHMTADREECTRIMNGFIRQVKAIVREAEAVHGHPVKIAIRVGRDMTHTLHYGLDPVYWAKEKLFDVLIPTPRFRSSDSGMPVEEWKALLPGVEIVPGIETLVSVSNGCASATKEIAFGLCANYLSYDPDGLYFYNYFLSPLMYGHPPQEDSDAHPTWVQTRSLAVLHNCGDYETIYNNPVRFALITQTDDHNGCPPCWQPVPARLSEEETVIELRTGAIPSGKLLSLIVGVKSETHAFSVSLNGSPCRGWMPVDIEFIPGMSNQWKTYVDPDVVCYRCVIGEEVLRDPVQTVTVTSPEGGILSWVELDVV